MILISKPLLILCSILFSGRSLALIHLEPYLNFNLSGEGKEKLENGDMKSYEYNTIHYGGRAGFNISGFTLGGDYSNGESVVGVKTNGISVINNYKKIEYGPFIGINQKDYRYFVTYLIHSSLNQKTGSGNRFQHKGKGIYIGIGKIFDDTFSVNLEYKKLKYNKEIITNISPITSKSKHNPLMIQEISVSISWIIDLFSSEKKK